MKFGFTPEAEILNARAAMIGFVAAVGSYLANVGMEATFLFNVTQNGCECILVCDVCSHLHFPQHKLLL